MLERKKQEAGDNSLQLQAENIIIGIDEKRAREIIDEKARELIKEYSQEARVIAKERTRFFEEDLIPRLIKEKLLEELKDPSIQILLLEAQKTAASTERIADYSLLSELLIHRMKKGADRNIQAGVNRAVGIVDEISDEALLGLTAAHSISYFVPISDSIEDGVKILANIFEKILQSKLPSGKKWLDHLDTLNAIRINSIGSFKKIKQWYSEKMPGYIDVGIEKFSENFHAATKILNTAALPTNILRDHELRNGYVRLGVAHIDNLEFINIKSYRKLDLNGQTAILPVESPLSESQKRAIREVYSLYNNESQLREENIDEFLKLWNTQSCLNQLRDWWDSIPQSFDITAVGRVLAHANAQRCDPRLPALD